MDYNLKTENFLPNFVSTNLENTCPNVVRVILGHLYIEHLQNIQNKLMGNVSGKYFPNISNGSLFIVKKFKLFSLDQRQLRDAVFVHKVFNNFNSQSLYVCFLSIFHRTVKEKKLHFISVEVVPTTT